MKVQEKVQSARPAGSALKEQEKLTSVEEDMFAHPIWQVKGSWLHLYKSDEIEYGVKNLLKEMSRYGVSSEVMD